MDECPQHLEALDVQVVHLQPRRLRHPLVLQRDSVVQHTNISILFSSEILSYNTPTLASCSPVRFCRTTHQHQHLVLQRDSVVQHTNISILFSSEILSYNTLTFICLIKITLFLTVYVLFIPCTCLADIDEKECTIKTAILAIAKGTERRQCFPSLSLLPPHPPLSLSLFVLMF